MLERKVAILKYWKVGNLSIAYSMKLNALFTNAIKSIQKNPSLGRPSEDPEVKNILAGIT